MILTSARLANLHAARSRLIDLQSDFEVVCASHLDLPSIAFANLAFCDPPYNIGVNYGKGRRADLREPQQYRSLLCQIAIGLREQILPRGSACMLVGEDQFDDASHAMRTKVGPRANWIIWHEKFAQYQRAKLTREHRHLLHHEQTKGLADQYFDAIREPSQRMVLGDRRAAGPRIPGNVWQVSRLQGTSTWRVPWHPAQLPPDPLRRLVKMTTRPGEIVVEICSGSCILGMVCLELGRRYLGIDINPDYVRRGRARLRAYQRTLKSKELSPA